MLLQEPTPSSLLAPGPVLPLLLEQVLLLDSVLQRPSVLPAFSARLLFSQLAWLLVQRLLVWLLASPQP